MNIGENLWHDIVEKLKEEFSETTVGLWFGSATIGSLDGDSVTIVAEDDFKKSIIEKKYLPVLERMFEELLGFKVEVRVDSATGDSDARSEERLFVTSAPPARPDPAAQEKPAAGPNLRSEYTFDNFVVGSSNQLAQAAAYAVAQHPAELYNPLFLFGPSGLGKTHLLFAIMNEVRKLHPNFNILYVTSEEFTNELIDALALRQNRNLAFKEKYRNVDMLLVDDVHFIAGKYSVQEEFFHTFNALYNEKKQIILTSDRPPRDISYLESRLQTRFESGLMADIQPPDTELRAAIFKMKTQLLGIRLDNEVLTYLSENITNNVRQIEGALKRLRAQSFITGEPISKAMAADVLKDFFTTDGAERVTIEKVFSFVSRRYGFSTEDIRGKKRTSDIVYVRHIAMYLCTEYTGLSLKAIGRQFGRDHSTVINARDNVINRMKKDSAFDKEIRELSKELTTL
ncbi:MAG: chromosomal replication initiator protein DnaA [Candidatus Woodwardiibium sp.]